MTLGKKGYSLEVQLQIFEIRAADIAGEHDILAPGRLQPVHDRAYLSQSYDASGILRQTRLFETLKAQHIDALAGRDSILRNRDRQFSQTCDQPQWRTHGVRPACISGGLRLQG